MHFERIKVYELHIINIFSKVEISIIQQKTQKKYSTSINENIDYIISKIDPPLNPPPPGPPPLQPVSQQQGEVKEKVFKNYN